MGNNFATTNKYMAPFASLKKQAETLFSADLLWEKNTFSAEKTSWKVRIIKQANRSICVLELDGYVVVVDRGATYS